MTRFIEVLAYSTENKNYKFFKYFDNEYFPISIVDIANMKFGEIMMLIQDKRIYHS